MDKKNTKYLSIIVSFILVFGSLAPVLVLTALAINSPLIEIQNPISESFESDLKVDTAKLGSLQIPFIQNQGQLNEEVKFYVSTFTGTIFVTESELTYSLIGVASDDDTVQEVIILEKFYWFQ